MIASYIIYGHKFPNYLDRKPCSVRWEIVFKSIPIPYKQKAITRGCDGYIESLVCEIDRSQSRHMFCWCGSGSGSPARRHDHLYIAYQIPPTITCSAIYPVTKVRPICPVCQLVAYMSRPEAKIADKDHTVKGPQKIS